MLDQLDVVICSRRSQSFSSQIGMKPLDLLTRNQVQLGIAEHGFDSQTVQLIIPLPGTLARLHVRQVMTLEQLREGQYRLASLLGGEGRATRSKVHS